MPPKSYIVRNPRGIRKEIRVFEMRGTSYFEGDRVARADLDDKKKDLEALVGLGIVAVGDLTEADSELMESSGVEGMKLEEVLEKSKDARERNEIARDIRETMRLLREAEAAEQALRVKAEKESSNGS